MTDEEIRVRLAGLSIQAHGGGYVRINEDDVKADDDLALQEVSVWTKRVGGDRRHRLFVVCR
jgi:hypothetical protein